MIREIIIYETDDGKRFDTFEKAKEWDDELSISYDRAIPVMDYLVSRIMEETDYDRVVPICNIIFAISMQEVNGRHLYEILNMFHASKSGFSIWIKDLINYTSDGVKYNKKEEKIRKIEETEDIRLARNAFEQFKKEYPFVFELDSIEAQVMLKDTYMYYMANSIVEASGKASVMLPESMYQKCKLALKDPRPIDLFRI